MTKNLLSAILSVAWALTSQAQTNDPNPHLHEAVSTETGAVSPTNGVINSRTLFLKNCAHCHGAAGHGDDGPDLHDLELSDDRIANRIRHGKAGQMTAFAGKLQPDEITALVAYVQSLK